MYIYIYVLYIYMYIYIWTNLHQYEKVMRIDDVSRERENYLHQVNIIYVKTS